MKWFKSWFANKCREAWEESRDAPEVVSTKLSNNRVVARHDFEADNGLNMRLYKAIGGRIVAFNHYDRKSDRENRTIYIITDEQDFERELGKIITLETMRG